MLRSPPRYSRPDLPPLDEADQKLIEVLLKDGRASGRRLAQDTGLSEANVSRRLTRLTEEQSIRIRCWVPPQYLGLSFQAVLFLRVERDHAAVAERLRRTGSMAWITAAFGMYDMVAYTCVAGASEMLTVIDEAVATAPGVRAVTLAPILEFYTPLFRLKPGQANRSGATATQVRSIDETDLGIIRELQRDGRASYADLATRVGISATSAADRFRRLQQDGIVDIVTFVDPPRLGMNLCGAILIAASGPLRPVMSRLGEFPELTFLTVLAGDFSGYVQFNCKNQTEFNGLRSRILAVEGVRDVQPLIFGELYHESVEWGSSLGEVEANGEGTPSKPGDTSVTHAPSIAREPS